MIDFQADSDPEVVVTHVCFLGGLTWEQSKKKTKKQDKNLP